MRKSYAATMRKAMEKYGRLTPVEYGKKPEFRRWPYSRVRATLYNVIHAESATRWRKDNFIRSMLSKVKYRCKVRNVYFDIRYEDFEVPDVCPVLGISMDRRDLDHTPSLDRFDNTLGYTPDNVNMISQRANRIKNDSTLEEIEKLYQWMKKKSQ